jgi:hypothetical protein
VTASIPFKAIVGNHSSFISNHRLTRSSSLRWVDCYSALPLGPIPRVEGVASTCLASDLTTFLSLFFLDGFSDMMVCMRGRVQPQGCMVGKCNLFSSNSPRAMIPN